MNRLNPIYIGASLLVVLILFAFGLSNAKAELSDAKALYASTSKLANELSSLKSVYSSKSSTKNTLERILRHNILKSAAIEKNVKSSGMTISSEGMDIKSLNYLMGKLYNGAYNISVLSIKKLSEEKSSLYVEIKW